MNMFKAITVILIMLISGCGKETWVKNESLTFSFKYNNDVGKVQLREDWLSAISEVYFYDNNNGIYYFNNGNGKGYEFNVSQITEGKYNVYTNGRLHTITVIRTSSGDYAARFAGNETWIVYIRTN